jgi:hypothetical protein
MILRRLAQHLKEQAGFNPELHGRLDRVEGMR